MSKDFAVPEAPDPRWRVVDSKGTVYLRDRVQLKDDKVNRSIMFPAYVPDVAQVRVWCEFMEVAVGEVSFTKLITLRGERWATSRHFRGVAHSNKPPAPPDLLLVSQLVTEFQNPCA